MECYGILAYEANYHTTIQNTLKDCLGCAIPVGMLYSCLTIFALTFCFILFVSIKTVMWSVIVD